MSFVNVKFKLLFFLILLFTFLIAVPCLGEVIVFNDNVIGKTMGSSISLVSGVSLNTNLELKPNRIETYFEDGKYSVAVVFYPFNKSNFKIIANTLDAIYHGSEQKWIGTEYKYWRIYERKLAVFLAHDKLCEDSSKEINIAVTYKVIR